MALTAKSVVKNKFWILEDNGEKVGSIVSSPAGYMLISNNHRERFDNFNVLKSHYNIHVDKNSTVKSPAGITHEIYGFATDHKPFNALWDVPHKVPVFTKERKSKSFYCAGYYVVKPNEDWEINFCPKLITINRYPYFGPFQTAEQAATILKDVTHGTVS